jgi:hypothetical protein
MEISSDAGEVLHRSSSRWRQRGRERTIAGELSVTLHDGCADPPPALPGWGIERACWRTDMTQTLRFSMLKRPLSSKRHHCFIVTT